MHLDGYLHCLGCVGYSIVCCRIYLGYHNIWAGAQTHSIFKIIRVSLTRNSSLCPVLSCGGGCTECPSGVVGSSWGWDEAGTVPFSYSYSGHPYPSDCAPHLHPHLNYRHDQAACKPTHLVAFFFLLQFPCIWACNFQNYWVWNCHRRLFVRHCKFYF